MKTNTPWATLDAMMAAEQEPTGPGWFSLKDFMDRYRLVSMAATRRLEAMRLAGKAKRWCGVGATASGQRRKITKYHLL